MSKNASQKNAAGQQTVPVVVMQNAKSTDYANVFHTQPMDGGIALSYGVSLPENRNTENGEQTIMAVYLENRIMMTLETANRLAQNLAQAVQQVVAAQTPAQ